MNTQSHKLLFYAYGRGVITASQLKQLLSMDIEVNGLRGIDYD
jgi:hypothetical protein